MRVNKYNWLFVEMIEIILHFYDLFINFSATNESHFGKTRPRKTRIQTFTLSINHFNIPKGEVVSDVVHLMVVI